MFRCAIKLAAVRLAVIVIVGTSGNVVCELYQLVVRFGALVTGPAVHGPVNIDEL